jgi:hypothetical protein
MRSRKDKEMTTTATKKKFGKYEYDPSTLKVLRKFEGYYLAKKPDGNLGIFGNHTEDLDFDAMRAQNPDTWMNAECEAIYLDEPYEVAYQFDDDCNHLLQKEWEGLFEQRVWNLKMEAASWA